MPKRSRDSIVAQKQREKSIVTKQKEIQERHKVVADALLEGATESDALRAAGYHPGNASRVIRQEEVQNYLAEARKQTEDMATIKRIDVMNMFLEAIDMARTLADPAQMINGADKIAKMMGYYAPETKRLEITDTTNGVLASKLKAMTDEELYQLAAQNAKVIDGEVVSNG